MGVILNLLSVFLKLALGGIGWLGQVTYGATRAFAEVAVQELKAIRKVVPFWVPAGTVNTTGRSMVGTLASPPSTALYRSTGTVTRRSSPSRVKRGCGATVTVRYRSPAWPPLAPASPWPLMRTREPVRTPFGTLTSMRRPPSHCSARVPPLNASSSDTSTGASTSRPLRGRIAVMSGPTPAEQARDEMAQECAA